MAQEARSELRPIIQIHPTRRCNLRCLHCYSWSGPEERDLLSAETLRNALTDAAAQASETTSFSGGRARALSRAWRAVAACQGSLHAHHCHLKRHAAGPRPARHAGRFAVEQGAQLFQIHPLEQVRRAAETLAGSRPDEVESAYAFLEAERIRQVYGDRLFVQLDVFHRDLVQRCPQRFYADEDGPGGRLLAHCLTPLVIEADGTVVPIEYGFSRQFALGSLNAARLSQLAPLWIQTRYAGFRDLCRRVYAEACMPSELPFLNWYELVGARSAAPSALP